MTTIPSHYPLKSDGAINSDKDQPNGLENTTNSPTTPEPERMDDEAAQLRKLQRLVRRKNDSPFAHIRHSKKRAYATALAITGMKGRAAELAGVHKSTPNTKQWREDRELQEALRQAEQMVGDLIEDELSAVAFLLVFREGHLCSSDHPHHEKYKSVVPGSAGIRSPIGYYF